MDAWHPAVNPSSRMPIHHIRYHELFDDYIGVLNEFPRKYGSSTIREMMIDENGVLGIRNLNSGLKWMPWWISSDSEKAHSIISNIFNDSIKNAKDTRMIESYEYYLELYDKCASNEKTMGEIAYLVNNMMFDEILPIFHPKMVSFGKSIVYRPMYDVLLDKKEEIYDVLNGLLLINGTRINNMIAVYIDVEGTDWHVSYELYSNQFVIYSLENPKRKRSSSIHELVELFGEKKVLLGSLLSLVIEEYMQIEGDEIVHFGNTYGKIEQICRVLRTDNELQYLNDDEDSWNYANFRDVNGYVYPIHLLETFAYRNEIRSFVKSLIELSLIHKSTEIIGIQKGDNLVTAICH